MPLNTAVSCVNAFDWHVRTLSSAVDHCVAKIAPFQRLTMYAHCPFSHWSQNRSTLLGSIFFCFYFYFRRALFSISLQITGELYLLILRNRIFPRPQNALACWPFWRENSDFSSAPHRYTPFFISRTLTEFLCVNICETTTSCFKCLCPAFSLSLSLRPSSCSGSSSMQNIPFKLIICKNYFLFDFFPPLKCIIIWHSDS